MARPSTVPLHGVSGHGSGGPMSAGGWDVVPGRGLGPFVIGMPVSEALATLQRAFPAAVVSLFYGEADPLAVDIILSVEAMGLKLRFEPNTQRLRLIDVHDASRLALRYAGTQFSGPDAGRAGGSRGSHGMPGGTPASFIRVYELFGPTFPGELNAAKGVYFLHYRGLSFAFPIPPQFHDLYRASNEMPLELPDATTPVASRVFVYAGSDLFEPQLPSSTGYDPVTVFVDVSHDRLSAPCFFGTTGEYIDFGSSAQDVLSVLGPPSQVFAKQPPKMHIHSLRAGPGAAGAAGTRSSVTAPLPPPLPLDAGADYFFNYFDLGVDVLLDGASHTVKKVVLRTNCPGHPEFNRYTKCSFTVRVPMGAPPAPPGQSVSHVASVPSVPPIAAPEPVAEAEHAPAPAPSHEAASGAPLAVAASASGASGNNGKKGKKKKSKKERRLEQAQAAAETETNAEAVGASDSAATATGVLGEPAAATSAAEAALPASAAAAAEVTAPPVRVPSTSAASSSSAAPAAGSLVALAPQQYAEINANMTWTDVEARLGRGGRPMVHTHGVSSHPFGATYFYAYEGLVFEVLKGGFIASVTVFDSDR